MHRCVRVRVYTDAFAAETQHSTRRNKWPSYACTRRTSTRQRGITGVAGLARNSESKSKASRTTRGRVTTARRGESRARGRCVLIWIPVARFLPRQTLPFIRSYVIREHVSPANPRHHRQPSNREVKNALFATYNIIIRILKLTFKERNHIISHAIVTRVLPDRCSNLFQSIRLPSALSVMLLFSQHFRFSDKLTPNACLFQVVSTRRWFPGSIGSIVPSP